MMMHSNKAMEAAIAGSAAVDRDERIESLTRQLAKVKMDIAEQEATDKWLTTVQTAYAKMKRELLKTLTPEEYQAVDGAYLFLHAGCVDLVHEIPSTTSKGEDTRFQKDLHTAEAMRELAELTN